MLWLAYGLRMKMFVLVESKAVPDSEVWKMKKCNRYSFCDPILCRMPPFSMLLLRFVFVFILGGLTISKKINADPSVTP